MDYETKVNKYNRFHTTNKKDKYKWYLSLFWKKLVLIYLKDL